MAAVADAKGIEAGTMSVRVRLKPEGSLSTDGSGESVIESEIVLSTLLSTREKIILYNSARACEVHRLLRGPIRFSETLRLVDDIVDIGIESRASQEECPD